MLSKRDAIVELVHLVVAAVRGEAPLFRLLAAYFALLAGDLN